MERDDKITQMLETTGKAAAESLAEMVAALNCDYDRLEELRSERDAFNADRETPTSGMWHEEFSEDAAELAELETAAGECTSQDEARERIEQDALSVEVRPGWVSIFLDELNEPEEFKILLGTGGPASRIIGELRNGEPYRARLQVQDWGTPWVDVIGAEDDALAYASVFYFGEG
jgi:uncharacterized protein (DUF2126 family)